MPTVAKPRREPGDLLLWLGGWQDFACWLADPRYDGAFASAAAVAAPQRYSLIDGDAWVTLQRPGEADPEAP